MNALQAEQHRQRHGHPLRRLAGIVESTVQIVVVEERDEVAAGIAVRAEQALFEPLAVVEDPANPLDGVVLVGHRRQGVEERKVQRGIDPVALDRGAVAPDEIGDGPLLVPDFPEGEEVLLAVEQGELADGIPEDLGRLRGDELGGVDPEAVDVETRDQGRRRARPRRGP